MDISERFVRFPSELADTLLLLGLNAREWNVVILICRFTYGCHQEWTRLLVKDFKVIAISPSHIQEILLPLIEKRIIVKRLDEYKINEEYLYGEFTVNVQDKLEDFKRILGAQLKNKFSQKRKQEFPKLVKKGFLYGEKNASQNGNNSRHGLALIKDILKDKSKDSDKDSIANIPIKKEGLSITNPKGFVPTNEGETAAFEAWTKLEPYNPIAFNTTYLWAYRVGLPASLFYRFSSEILQDSTIHKKGAVFRTKVEDFLSETSR